MRIFLTILLIESLTFASPQEACYNVCGEMAKNMNKNLDGHNALEVSYIASINKCIIACGSLKESN